jgi:ATP-dependent exoDNAse (exonuclease V) beta subunit
MRARDEEARERDAEARRAAVREFSRPLLVEAGAGTGKTALLVARIVAWLLGPGWERAEAALRDGRGGAPPRASEVAARAARRVVAITFTEAAAAEMASRLGSVLAELAAGGSPRGVDLEAIACAPEARAERAREALGALDLVVVRTIHAFCRRLLLAHPLERGLHPGFEVDADGSRTAEVVREVVEAALGRLYADGDSAALALASRGSGPPEIEAAIGWLVAEGVDPEWLVADPCAPERLEVALVSLVDDLRALAEAGGRGLASLAGERGRGAEVAAANARTLARAEVAASCPSRESMASLLEELRALWTPELLERLVRWGAARWGSQAETRALAGSAEAVAPAARSLAQRLRFLVRLELEPLDHARAVVAPILASARAELRARGILGFSDLLREASALLREQPAIARSERGEIDQLLVDEFQDTDPVQCRVIEALALEGEPVRRPALFVVGDPKQSIYGFRSADLRSYDDFAERLRAAGGVRHVLCVSFRSYPEILAEVERVVAPVMRPVRGLQPAFQPLVASEALAAAPGAGAPRVEHWIAWGAGAGGSLRSDLRIAETLEIEARALARDLRRRAEEGLALADVAVLLRSLSEVEPVLAELREAGIPYVIERDRRFYGRREILDAAAVVRAILDPHDHLALVAALRSPLVGVPDAAWVPLWARGLPSKLARVDGEDAAAVDAVRACAVECASALPADVPGLAGVEGWEIALGAFAEALASLRRSFRRDAADRFVEALRTRLLVEAHEAMRPLGRFRVANLERFFVDLRRALEETREVPELLRRLRRAVASEAETERRVETVRVREAAADGVQVMTIHGAKGLDFSRVYLLQTHRQPGSGSREPNRSGLHLGRGEYRLLGLATPGFHEVERRRLEVEAAERVRALYVALTRAKHGLVVSGAWPAQLGEGDAGGSLVDLVARRGPDPAELAAAFAERPGAEGAAPLDRDGVRFRFPALEPGTAGSAAPPAAADSAAAADPARDASLLAARRRRAAARAAQPLERAASEEAHAELEERFAADLAGGRAEGGPERVVALSVGTAVHRALEVFDPAREPGAELARLREVAAASLAELPAGPGREQALARAGELLARFVRGRLGARLREIGAGVVARELPVLAAEADLHDSPTATLGAIDLVFREPDTGEWVIVDYKTDALRDAAEEASRGERYRSQLAAYRAALQRAQGLDRPPRTELWFVASDRIVTLPESDGEGARGSWGTDSRAG